MGSAGGAPAWALPMALPAWALPMALPA